MLVAASRNRSDSGSRPEAAPPSWVTMRGPRVRIGAVTLARSGRRLVPENLGMTPLLSCVGWYSMVWGPAREQGVRAVPSRTAAGGLPHGPHQKDARPSQLTGTNPGPGTRA